ncbi:MAG: hypothetical protein LIP09_13410 [Bacteroidales bacterium]|nr:hypothetical protein [Bacteroidales bacterium]
MRKTYIVNGLVEWTAAIQAGRATISVPFTGGAFTKYGHTPARFTTADAAMQRIIESSDHFKKGRIKAI